MRIPIHHRQVPKWSCGTLRPRALAIVLTILLTSAAFSARAQSSVTPTAIWTSLFHDRVVVIEIDRARVHRITPTVAEAWTRVTYATPDTASDGQLYTQFVQHAVYDCQASRYRVGQLVLFDRDGRILKVMSESTTPVWRPTPPGSVADTERRGACSGTSA